MRVHRAARRRRPRCGTPAAASRPTSTAAPGSPRAAASSAGRAQRDRARVPRRERRRGRARAARRAAGQPPPARPARRPRRPARRRDRRRASLSLVQRDNARTAESAAAGAGADLRRRAGRRAGAGGADARALAAASPPPGSSSRIASRRAAHLLTVAAAATRRRSALSGCPRSTITALAASPDGRLLASGDDGGVVRFIDLRTWKPIGAPVRAPAAGRAAGDALLAGRADARGGHAAGDRTELYLIDVTTHGEPPDRRRGGRRRPRQRPEARRSPSRPDGRRLAVGLATWSDDGLHGPGRPALAAPRRPQRAPAVAAAPPAPARTRWRRRCCSSATAP